MTRRFRALAALAAASALIAMAGDAGAASQLFKCVEGGRTVYQQQACPVSAQADAPASAPHATVKAEATPGAPRKLKPAAEAASAVSATPR
jgi:hypothetical protein